MRAMVLVLVLLLAVGTAYFAFAGDDVSVPPIGTVGPSAAKPPQDPGPAERSPSRVDETPAVPAADPAAAAAAAVADNGTAAVKGPRVVFVVQSAADRVAIAEFVVTMRTGTTATRTDGAAGKAEVVVPPQAELEALVEAKGFQPWHGPVQGPADGAPDRTVEVFLVPAATQAGIELLVHTLDGAPVTRLCVEAQVLPQGDRAPWPRGRPLWSRVADGATGHYRLPELKPGDYGIRALAIDAQGDLIPLLPFQRAYALTGTNGFVEDVALEPGCVFGIDLADGGGTPFAPSPETGLSLQLRTPGGTEIARTWIQSQDGRRTAALDQLPGPGPAWLDEAIPAGTYELTARAGNTVRLQTQVTLRVGERQLERFVVW